MHRGMNGSMLLLAIHLLQHHSRTPLNYWKLNPRNQCSVLLTLGMVGYYDLVLGFCSQARENAMNSYLTQQIGDFAIWSGGYRLESREIVCPLVIAYENSGTALKCTWNPSMKVSITHGAPNNIFSIILLQNCGKHLTTYTKRVLSKLDASITLTHQIGLFLGQEALLADEQFSL